MDLWATSDYHDDESTQATGASENERAQSTRKARRLTDSAVLSLFRSWLLQDYVPAYCHTLATTRIFKRCYWIDALGVEGRRGRRASSTLEADVQSSSHVEPVAEPVPKAKSRKNGAPLVVPPDLQPVVSLAEMLARESKPIHLRGLLLEAGSGKGSRRPATPGQLREVAVPAESGIMHASWSEAAPSVLKGIEQSPAIFLLNPLGPTLFSYDDLAPLYQRTIPTEMCLLMPHKQIETRLPAASKNQMLASALTGLLRSNRWKSLPVELEKRDEEITGFVELFLASMQRHFQIPPQRIALPVSIGPASTAPLPYTLIYATRRQDSLLIMNDALCLYSRRVYRQSYQGVLGEEWFARQEQGRHESELQALALRVQQQGVASRTRRWPDLRQQVVLANFGQFTRDEYDAVMRQLLSRQEVHCTWRIPPGDSGERVPGNDDSLQWT